MKLLKHELLWAGAFYFLFLLSIALWVRDIPNQPDAFITIHELIRSSSMGDPASFATAAIDIAQNGWISSTNDWIFNLWPPGFILLEAMILKLMGPEAPVIFVLQVLTAILFSIVLTLLYDLLKTSINSKAAYVLPLFIFAFPVSRVFLIQPTGISLGECISIGFFMLSVLFAFRSVTKSSLCHAVVAGLCLALSAYFRSQFEFVLLVLTGWGIILIAATWLTPLRKTIEPRFVGRVFKTIAIVLLIAHAATIPWRIYHMVHPHYDAKLQKYVGSPNWVFTTGLIFSNSVKTSEVLKNGHGQFVVDGAGNLVCRIDPSTCGNEENAKKLLIKTFTEHLFEWYKLKFDVIGKYWFSSVEDWVAVIKQPRYMDFVVNGFILIALIVIAALLFSRKVRSSVLWVLLIWFNASLFSAYAVVFSLAHFEVRYFYFPKIAGIFMALIVVCQYFRPTVRIDIAREGGAR